VLQWPRPSQVLAPPLWVAPVQVRGTLQAVLAFATWHPPDPSQVPVLPQGGLAEHVLPSLGVPPAAMDVQVPGVAVQVWHPPVQLDEQHTFCTQ
jgi:hypothetical protein